MRDVFLIDRYVVSVGWDKRVNIYVDSTDDLHQIQHPLPNWSDDVVSRSTLEFKQFICLKLDALNFKSLFVLITYEFRSSKVFSNVH